jgi:hypothetical protein
MVFSQLERRIFACKAHNINENKAICGSRLELKIYYVFRIPKVRSQLEKLPVVFRRIRLDL